jgi:ubiquinone/menaquinone biosynthesis C-methylase UbiE
MAANPEKQDKHFPLFAHDNWLRRRFMDPRKFAERYVREGQVVADLGCGPGFFTLALAEAVGPDGKVFAVDSDERAVRAVERKAVERGLGTIDARAVSASQLEFIADGSVDFVLCHGLLCSMAPDAHDAALGELKRILKPDGRAYLTVATAPGAMSTGRSGRVSLVSSRSERGIAASWVLGIGSPSCPLKNGDLSFAGIL